MQIFKMGDTSVCHPLIYGSFLDDTLVHHLPGEAFRILLEITVGRSSHSVQDLVADFWW